MTIVFNGVHRYLLTCIVPECGEGLHFKMVSGAWREQHAEVLAELMEDHPGWSYVHREEGLSFQYDYYCPDHETWLKEWQL